jgi:putative DNA-invertase from lambdoid prophage Rac
MRKGTKTTSTGTGGKFYGYVRVSTDRQVREGVSLAEQESRIRGYAQSLGMKVGKIFVEAGVSGGKSLSKRPKGGALLSLVTTGDHICVVKLDRMSRSSSDALAVSEELTRQGITLHCLDIGGAVNTDGVGKLVFSILAAVAEMERSRISERVRDAKTFLQSGSYFVGGAVPSGYIVKDGKLVARKNWKPAVVAIKKWRAEGLSYRACATQVAEQFGITMDASTIHRMLGGKRKTDALVAA